MSIFKKLSQKLGKGGIQIEEYLDALDEEEETVEEQGIYVKSLNLTSLQDLQNVYKELDRGNLILLNIEPLYSRDREQLRHAVSQIKKKIAESEGDVGRITNNKLLLTPDGIKIQRRR